MEVKNVGKVLEIKDGIIWADGLSAVGFNEKVLINTKDGFKITGLALNLEKNRVGIIVIGDYLKINQGDVIETTGELFSIKVSTKMLGRVIDPLGNPLDGMGEIDLKEAKDMPLMKIAPGVIDRKDVHRPMQTGIKNIDSMLPIGRGQRQLIIGDRQTGKTAILIDTIINQKQSAEELGFPLVKCIYVAIGQKVSKVAQLVEKLKKSGAMEYSVVVIAGASDSASLQYIAPYVGTAIGEFFAENKEDALVLHDDLTKHAWAYRELSLLLRRPPGREAYPGDIFYLHSALLERGVQFNDEKGAGSLTCIPVVETQAGDVSAYIPTNIISITDGQIYLESDLFNAGVRPAVNIGLSVSRVGGAAQIKPMKQVAGQLRLDLAQYRSLAAFAQFGSDLDESTKKVLNRGSKIVELLKQGQYAPFSVGLQIALVYASTKGYIDDLPVESIRQWESDFAKYFSEKGKEIIKFIKQNKSFDEKEEAELKDLIIKFNESWKSSNGSEKRI